MYDTMPSLVERALKGDQRPLEYYLREQSRLPGSRANLGLVSDVSNLLAAIVSEQPDEVRKLLDYLVVDGKKPSGQRCRLSRSGPAFFEGSEQGLALVT